MTFLREQLHRSPRALAITLGVALIAYGVWDGGSFWITYTLVSYGVVFIVIAVLQPHRLGRDWRDRRPPDQKLMDAFRFLVCWRRWLIVGALILVAADIAILDYVARRGTEEMAKLIPTPGTAGGTLHRWEASHADYTLMLRVVRGEEAGVRLRDRLEAATWLADRGFGKPIAASEPEEDVASLIAALQGPERQGPTRPFYEAE